MFPPRQENQVVGLFGAVENQNSLSIAFAGENIWTVVETEQHQQFNMNQYVTKQ